MDKLIEEKEFIKQEQDINISSIELLPSSSKLNINSENEDKKFYHPDTNLLISKK